MSTMLNAWIGAGATLPGQRQQTLPPAGRASGPTTRTGPPAAGAPPLDPGDSGMPELDKG